MECCASGFVHGNGIAVIEALVALWIEADFAWLITVQTDAEFIRRGLFHGSQHAVFDTQILVVFAEHKPILGRKGAMSGIGFVKLFQRRSIVILA